MNLEMPAADLADARRQLLLEKLWSGRHNWQPQMGAIARHPDAEPVPLSLAQEQLSIREQRATEVALLNECFTIRSKEWLDARALRLSLAEICKRHEIWRTTYELINGRIVQVVHPPAERFPLRVLDLRQSRRSRLTSAQLAVMHRAACRRFNLKTGPLLRAMLLRLSDTDHHLFVCAHLSIIDGISVYQIFPTELALLYKAFVTHTRADLPDLPIQFSDYVYWERKRFGELELKRQKTHWQEELSGVEPNLQWPRCGYRTRRERHRGRLDSFTLTSTLSESLKRLARTEGITLFTVLVVCLITLIHWYTSQCDIVVATPSSAARQRWELQRLLGYFLNPVALRIRFEGDPTIRELLVVAQTAIARGISGGAVPMDLPSELIKEEYPAGMFCIPAGISLQPRTPSLPTGWAVTSMDANTGAAPWDIYFAFIDAGSHLVCRVQSNVDLIKSSWMANIMRDFRAAMEYVASDPQARLSEFKLASPLRSAWRANGARTGHQGCPGAA